MVKTIILNKQNDKLIFLTNINGKFEEKIFNFNKKLDLVGNIVEIYANDTLSDIEKEEISLKNKQVFVIDRSTISLKYRKDMAEVMFNLLDISKFYIASQSMLTLYDNDLSSGIVIDSCDDKLYTVPIFEENLVKNAVSEIKLDKNKNKYDYIINKKIKSTIRKCKINQQNDIKQYIIYSTNLSKELIENIDNFTGEIILGDPINGAKKIISLLNLHNCWITREKYDQNGSYIIEKKCFN